MRWLLLLVTGLILLAGCERKPELIVGRWTATEVQQESDSMRLNPEEIRFAFGADGRYLYQSTLRYEEAGRYRLEDGFLIARDTTRSGAQDVVVALELLNTDSLILKMQQAGKSRRLVFLRD